jgi:hypothetical protein
MKKTEKTNANGSGDPHAIPNMMQPNLKMATGMLTPMLSANIAMLNWNAKYCEKLAQGYKQWFDFVGHRIEEEATLAANMQSVKDPKEVAQVYSSFVERAAKDYQTELSELTKLTGELSSDATDALQNMSSSPDVGASMGE